MNELQVLQKNIFIDKQSGKDFDRPQYKKLLKNSARTICYTSRASTVSDATITKFKSNGVSSQKTRALTLWFWICPYWIPDGEKT